MRQRNGKMLLALLLAVIMLLTASCGTYSGGAGGSTPPDEGGLGSSGGGELSSDKPLEFTVKALYNGEYLDPEVLVPNGEFTEIHAVFSNGFSYHEADFDETGTAKIEGLDGEYRVTLSDLPTGYSYNPNIYAVTNDRREVVIELFDYKPTRGTGANLYEKCIKISMIGLYCAKLDNKDDIVYYEFTPKESGKYAVESWVDISANTVNPKIDIYYGTTAWKKFSYTLDDGAPGEQGTFTKNFRYEIEISPEEIGNAFTFGVRAGVTTTDEESIDINFAVTLNGSMGSKTMDKEMQVPYELLTHLYTELAQLKALSAEEFLSFMGDHGYYSDKLSEEYAKLQSMEFPVLQLIVNTDGSVSPVYSDNHKNLYEIINGTYITVETAEGELPYYPRLTSYMNGLYEQGGAYHYAESEMLGAEGRKLFDQNMYRVSPEDGFYHLYDPVKYPETNGYGPILYADVATGGRFLDSALNSMEYAGNKALTVDYTKNYKHFIEGYDSLITPRGGYPNITGAYYCVYQGEDPRVQSVNCPCIRNGCDRACYEGCETCTRECRFIDPNLDYAPGYADLANSHGRVPVTEELKQFLQSFSVSQRYFADGNGWVETNPNYAVDAPEDSQWLWACGYYE